MIFFIILTAERYRRTYLSASAPLSASDDVAELQRMGDSPDRNISLVLLQHLSNGFGLFDTLSGVWAGSDWLLEEDMSLREQFVELDFDVVLGLETTSELGWGGYEDCPTRCFSKEFLCRQDCGGRRQ